MYALTLVLFTIATIAGVTAFGVAPERVGMVDDAIFLIAAIATVGAIAVLFSREARGVPHRSAESLEDSSAARNA